MTASSRASCRFGVVAASMILVAWVSGPGARCGEPDPPDRAARRGPLVLTYIANEGVLVSSGETKVLIDALFDKPNQEYRAPSPDVLEAIMKAEAPYDGVDLVLVTHDHPDHFDAPLAARYMKASAGTVLLAPSDAVAELRKVVADWASIEPRVISLDMKAGKKAKKDPKGIPLTVYRTLHSGDRESPVNLMFLLEINGWRVFHEGDSASKADEYRRFGLGRAPVDLAMVHFWFPLEPDRARFLQEVLEPDHIALTHLPIRLESDAPGKIDQVRKSYKDIFLLLPGMQPRVIRD